MATLTLQNLPSFPAEAGIHRAGGPVMLDLIRNPEGRLCCWARHAGLDPVSTGWRHPTVTLCFDFSLVKGDVGIPALWILDRVQNDGRGNAAFHGVFLVLSWLHGLVCQVGVFGG